MPVMLQALILHALYVLTFNVPNSPVMVATDNNPHFTEGETGWLIGLPEVIWLRNGEAGM